MAVSAVQLAKLALQHLGDRYDITSLDQDTTEAEQVNLVFDNVRDALLREHPWNFTRRYVSPAALSGTPPAQWTYMYTYPSDAMRVIRIVHPLDPRGEFLDPLDFAVGRNATDTKVLLTDQAEPEFEYIKKITSVTEFDPLFDWAFSWRLAQAIAMPITGDGAIADATERKANDAVGRAKMEDANEGSTSSRQSRDPDWINARK